jgi:integrase
MSKKTLAIQLSEEAVLRIKPPTDLQYANYYDALVPGLILRVNAGGRKAWVARYYRKGLDKDGKAITIPTTKRLGRYPVLKVKEARDIARKFIADPQKGLAETSDTVEKVATEFMKRHVEANKLRTQADIERILKKYVYPKLGQRPFRDLKRSELTALFDKIEDNHGPRMADMVLAIIRKVTNWFASRNDDYVSPVVKGMARSKPGENRRKRILTDAEIVALFKAADEAGTFGAIVKVLFLTAQRRDKVVSMQWDDIEGDVWTIASEAREKSNAGSLRLPPSVVAIIEAQPQIVGNPYVFVAGKGDGQFNSFSQRKEELEKELPAMPGGDWVLHDLRRTARSLMSRAGVRPDISERVLGHAIAGVEGVYDRHSYDAEKADALTKLAALVETILNPPEGNVVAIQGRTRRRGRTQPSAT